MGPPTPTRTEPGREGHAGSTSEICVQGFSISGDGSLQGGRVMQLLLGGTQKSSPALGAAHTPDTDVNQRLTMDQTVVQGIHQAHGIFLQDHQHVLALPRTESWQMKVANTANKQFTENLPPLSHRVNPWRNQTTHLTPGTIMGLAPVASLGQLLDTVIDSNTALPWCQVLLRHLYPAQRADCKALTRWGKRSDKLWSGMTGDTGPIHINSGRPSLYT